MNEVHGTPTHEEIAIAAYYIWQKETYHAIRHGRTVVSDPDGDWVRAEQQLKGRAWHYGSEAL